jgi:hypothetical protein
MKFNSILEEVIKYIRHRYSTKKKLKVLAAAVYIVLYHCCLAIYHSCKLKATTYNLPHCAVSVARPLRRRHLVRQSFSPCHGHEHQMMLNVYHRAIERRLAFEARTEAPVLLESDASSARLDWPVGAARFVVVCNSQDTWLLRRIAWLFFDRNL